MDIITSTTFSNGDVPLDSVMKTWLSGWTQNQKNAREQFDRLADEFFSAFLGIQNIFQKFAELYPDKEETVFLTIPKILLENKSEASGIFVQTPT